MATTVLSGVLTAGKLAVPAKVREELGLKEGDKVEFTIKKTPLMPPPASPDGNPFEQYVGMFPGFGSIEEINAYYRDLRDDNEGGLTKW